MQRTTRLALASTLTLGLLASGVAPAEAASPVVEEAIAYLDSVQESDGGFEVSDFALFETPDAILAIAEAAQTGPDWSTLEAATAVRAFSVPAGRTGRNPLDAVDDAVEESVNAGQAAKLIVLVSGPLGLDATEFDPSGDGSPVDLVSTLDAGRGDDGSLEFFSGTLYGALADAVLGRPTPAGLETVVVEAQRPDGSWNYLGDQDEAVAGDTDTTSLAVQALVALVQAAQGEARATSRGLRFLARQQTLNGAFPGFSGVNSTAVASLAVTAAGYRLDDPCWKSEQGVERAYTSPLRYLRSQVQTDGSINDAPGSSAVFSTSQAVQALLRRWLPVRRAPTQCASSRTYVTELSEVIGRNLDEAQARSFGTAIGGGTATRFDVALSQLETRQFRIQQLNRYYRIYLGRKADAEGRRFYLDRLAVNDSLDDVVALFLGSSDYAEKAGGTRAGLVNAFFEDLLGRPADDEAQAFFGAQLDRYPVAAVAASIATSAEGRNFLVRQLFGEPVASEAVQPYIGLFGRAPTGAELRRFSLVAERRGIVTTYARLLASQLFDDAIRR